MTCTLTASAAIAYAAATGRTLNKYADPIEGAREGLTVDEAREIAAEDCGLIYITSEPVSIDTARALIAEFPLDLTWSEAGDTWAILAMTNGATEYPAL